MIWIWKDPDSLPGNCCWMLELDFRRRATHDFLLWDLATWGSQVYNNYCNCQACFWKSLDNVLCTEYRHWRFFYMMIPRLHLQLFILNSCYLPDFVSFFHFSGHRELFRALNLHQRMGRRTSSCSLVLKSPSKVYMVKVWSPQWCYWEMLDPLGGET